MRNYPNKVYLSTSWHSADKVLSSYIVNFLMKAGLTVVGDHPDYQNYDPQKRVWTSRILKLVSDCSALVIIFPKRGNKQSTSFYMFPELLAADAAGIPILIFTHPGVLINKTKTTLGNNLHFGGSKSDDYLSYEKMFIEYNGNEEIDSKLNSSSTLKIINSNYVDGPYELPNNNIRHDEVITNFVNSKIKRVDGSFVFNVLPFSLKDKEHVEIAKAVFEETGLPCHISLDSIGESQRMREQWKDSLSKSEFVIAEFTQLRDTCLFEAGVVTGMGKKLFLVAKKEPKLPYGLDDIPLTVYKSINSLNKSVREVFCAEYKRKVYNLDEDILLSVDQENKKGGVPDWFHSNTKSISPLSKLTFSAWVLSLSFFLFIWSLLLNLGSSDTPVSFLSLGLSFIFGIGSHLRSIQSKFEFKYLSYANKLVYLSSGLLIGSIFSVVIAYKPSLISSFFN